MKLSGGSHHDIDPLLFDHWHDESGDNSPLDVEDVDGLISLGVESDLNIFFNRDLQSIPVEWIWIFSPFSEHIVFILSITNMTAYLAMASLKALAPAAGR